MARLPPHHKFATPSAAEAPLPGPTVGGTWTTLNNGFPGSQAAAPHLMMDGTLVVHDSCTSNWYKLRPDDTGSYVNGKWIHIHSMPSDYQPLYFASQVLADGRLIVNGGEYNGSTCDDAWTNLGAIYDPSADQWTTVPAPSGWTEIGDAQSVVLFNEDYMLANCCETTNSGGGRQAIWNPTTPIGTWTTTGAGKKDENDEEAWALLPNGDLLTGDAYVNTETSCTKDNTEVYNKKTGTWTSAGKSPVQLSDCTGNSTGNGPSDEVGPEVLRSNGTVVMFSGVATGTAAGTAIYNATTGKLSQGANVPKVGGVHYTLADAPAALEPSGKILYAASPGDPVFSTPTHFFEYSMADATQQISNDPAGASGNPSYVYNFLVLPTGQILETDQSATVQVYTPVGAPLAGLAPVITSVAKTLTRGTIYSLTGKQLNGLSEAGAYGDDNQSATDYPLIRVKNTASGNIYYCQTKGESSRDIAPGAVTTATFIVPTNVQSGPSTLQVVTNGIASAAKNVTIE